MRLATAAMGTRFELVLGGDSETRLRAAGEAAIEEIEQCHRRLSRFAPDSLLAHIHRTAHERPVRLDADAFALFSDALYVQRASDGAFDINVGRTMDTWRDSSPVPSGAPAARGSKREAHVGHPSFLLDPSDRTIRLRGCAVRLDLGAIAKGHALELAARVLREAGVTCALLHGGTSSVVAIGAPPGLDGWLIVLGGKGDASRVLLRDRALSVSSPISHGHDHILDPRTDTASSFARIAAVAGPCARLADAWSTALTVLGTRPAILDDPWQTWIT